MKDEVNRGRRRALQCMAWAHRRGVTIGGGVPRTLGLLGEASAAESQRTADLVQISDTISFQAAANPTGRDAREVIAKINALPRSRLPGPYRDISHLSKEANGTPPTR